jgi:predicted tellurium resistance membrane protein TerC
VIAEINTLLAAGGPLDGFFSFLADAGATTQQASDAASGGGHGPRGITNLLSFEALIALLTLTLLEIVLGIDNIVFIAILVAKLPADQQDKARRLGLGLAMGIRILLLLTISWIMGLTRPLFDVPKFWTSLAGDTHGVSGRDLILLLGGLFLIGKATYEIHDKLEGPEHGEGAHGGPKIAAASFTAIIIQILILDIVFSLDSVITAVGMVKTDPAEKWKGIAIMIAAVMIAVGVMMLAAGSVSRFVDRHPTVKMLALSFLILIGVMLVAEGVHQHVPKGYVYFAMAFALGVEMMNIRLRKVYKPVHLHQGYVDAGGVAAPVAGEQR